MILFIRAVALVFGGFLIWTLWRAGRPTRYFTIRIVHGDPRAVHGTVTPALLRLVREVAAFNDLKEGRISGVERGSGVGLEFSRSIPAPARQQLRNGWGSLGWKAPSGRARRG
jgi:hypothetical protein